MQWVLEKLYFQKPKAKNILFAITTKSLDPESPVISNSHLSPKAHQKIIWKIEILEGKIKNILFRIITKASDPEDLEIPNILVWFLLGPKSEIRM